MSETPIQELDKKDSKIIRNAVRYVLTRDMGIDEVSLKNITSPIIEERLNRKIGAILNTALDKINRKIEESIEKRLRQSALSNLMYSFEKDVLKPTINDFVKNVNVSFDYKKKSDSENDNSKQTTQKLYPVEVSYDINVGHILKIIDFDYTVKNSDLRNAIYHVRQFLISRQLDEWFTPLPKSTTLDSSKLHNIIFIGV